MKSITHLDVLVVYSADHALSASVADAISTHPFLLNSKQANYNLPYAHFLESCQKEGLTAGFTTSADIIGPGKCQNYWTSHAGKWQKVEQTAQSNQIFDKISPTSADRMNERELLLSSQAIHPFNDRALHATFFDKLLTYKRLPRYTLPTVGVMASDSASIAKALQKLDGLIRKHAFPQDFRRKLVLKDRFGAGGNHVYEIDQDFSKKIQVIMRRYPDVRFVLQPFLAFEAGFSYQGNQTATDIRLIFHHNKMLQCYFRMAKKDDFRCNEHQGGELIYVTKQDIPLTIQSIAQKLVTKIDTPDSLYALDFIMSNTGRAYFLEGNFGPGLDWNVDKKINEKMSKQLIHSIVDEFSGRLKKVTRLPQRLKNTPDTLGTLGLSLKMPKPFNTNYPPVKI